MKITAPSIKAAFGVLILFGALQNAALAAKENALYILQNTHAAQFDVLRLINTKTKRVLWTGHARADSWRKIQWSKNKRCVAVALDFPFFLVWREGFNPHLFRFAFDADWIEGFDWSPDNRRLLIRSDGSGGDVSLYSGISCLKINQRKQYWVSVGEKVSWSSPKNVVYWQPSNIKDQDHYSKRRRVWYSP